MFRRKPRFSPIFRVWVPLEGRFGIRICISTPWGLPWSLSWCSWSRLWLRLRCGIIRQLWQRRLFTRLRLLPSLLTRIFHFKVLTKSLLFALPARSSNWFTPRHIEVDNLTEFGTKSFLKSRWLPKCLFWQENLPPHRRVPIRPTTEGSERIFPKLLNFTRIAWNQLEMH